MVSEGLQTSVSFVRAVGALGGAADRAEAAGAVLLQRWREPHRGYHDEQHLTEVLAAIEELSGDETTGHRQRPLAVLAAWYHDAVYGGRPGDDEEASAGLAETDLVELGVEAEQVAEVARLVRATADHGLPPDGASDEAVLHDADLWILAAPAERFDAYCADVRREYAHVTDEDYRKGRRAVLEPFAERTRLYATEHAHEQWTSTARANLRREIERLSTRRTDDGVMHWSP